MQRALEPFFTTKQTGEGSGLGLSMVYGFVTQSGGEIDIQSSLSQGTSVKLILPIGRQPKLDNGQQKFSDPAITVKRNASVLLVEDDIEVSGVIREQLALMEFEVSVVHSVQHALEHLAVNTCDLVISDVNLGSTEDGVQLRQILASDSPSLPVILTSGLPIESLIEHHHFNPEWRFIAKPFQYEQLKAMINIS